MQAIQRFRTTRVVTTLSLALAAVLAAGMLSTAFAAPTTETSDPIPVWQATYNRMIAEIMSPYCHGLTLDDCPTQGATELRNEIRAWLMQGRSEDAILDELVLRFGPSILGAPRMSGMGLVAWLVPPLAMFLGTIGVVVYLRRHGPSSQMDPETS